MAKFRLLILLHILDVFHPPGLDAFQNGGKFFSDFAQGIFHLGRDLRVFGADNQSLRLELFELIGEGRVRHLGHLSPGRGHGGVSLDAGDQGIDSLRLTARR